MIHPVHSLFIQKMVVEHCCAPDTVAGVRDEASSDKPDRGSCPCAASLLKGVKEAAGARQPHCFPVLAGPTPDLHFSVPGA